MWVIQFEFTGYEVDYVDEVVDVGDPPPCSMFGQWYFGIDAFEQSVVEIAGLEVGQHAIPMFFNGFGEVLKRYQFGIVSLVAPKGEVAGSGFGIGGTSFDQLRNRLRIIINLKQNRTNLLFHHH